MAQQKKKPATRKRTTTPKITANGAGPAVLATITDEEKQDYIRRRQLFDTKQLEALAAAHYMDILGEVFIEKYNLPTAYNLDLQTGIITEVE